MSFSNLTLYQARFRQWGKCARCGKSLDNYEEFPHALYPQSQGGPEKEENCVLLCRGCYQEAENDSNSQSCMTPPLSYFPFANIYGGHATGGGVSRRR